MNLPVDSDVLYFISKGSMSHGLVNIADDGDVDAKSIKVDITFVYDHEEDLDLAKVCLLQPEEGHNGVGIFVSTLLLYSPFISILNAPHM